MTRDLYGNYVVQTVLKLTDPCKHDMIINSVKDHVQELGQRKGASNVIERCLEIAREDSFAALLTSISKRQTFRVLLFDSYGNYII